MMVSQFIRESVRKGHGGTQVYAETLLNEVEFLERELAAERQKSAQLAGALKPLIGILNDDALEDASNEWGNTNVAVAKHHRDIAREALQAASGSEGE